MTAVKPLTNKIFWWIAIVLMALNLLNLLAWTAGNYVHPALFGLTFLTIFAVWRQSNTWVLLALTAMFFMIILGSSIIAWDARSIWFFHGKRIFIDSNLYSQLDKYPGWSHADYPVLVPALAASVASAFGFWNEALPRIAVVIAVIPGLVLFAWMYNRAILFNLWSSAILVIGGNMLLNGYMDAILAIYCAAASLILIEIYRHLTVKSAIQEPQWRLQISFALVLSHILFLKNEGLLAALMLWICWLPQFYWRSARIVGSQLFVSLLPFLFYFFVWKLPLIKNGISGDTFLPGILLRLFAFLQNTSQMLELAATFASVCGIYVALLAISFAFAIRHRFALSLLPSAVFITGYWTALLCIYMITPHGLSWILLTTADRTWMTANLSVVSLALYVFGRIFFNDKLNVLTQKSNLELA